MLIGRLDAAEVEAAVGVEDDDAEAYDGAPGVVVEVEVELVEVDIGWPPEGTPVVL